MAASTEHSTEHSNEHTSEQSPSLSITPLFAVVGATDLAVQQVRAAKADFEKRVGSLDPKILLDPKHLKAQAEQAPVRAVARALEVAGKAEAAYEELARRGKDLFDRVYTQPETQAFRDQAGNTLNRGRAAVTVARRAADDTASAIRGGLPRGRTDNRLDQEALEKAVAVGEGGNKPVGTQPVTRTRTAANKTAGTAASKTAGTTARKNAAATKTAAKGTQTSARKTAATGTRAARTAAKKVGD
jgi:heparin binding hemagglutinin HbhA